jgi:hypothetical protein
VLRAWRDGRITRDPDGQFNVARVKREWPKNTDTLNDASRFYRHDPADGDVPPARVAYLTYRAAMMQIEYQRRSRHPPDMRSLGCARARHGSKRARRVTTGGPEA